MPVGVVILAGGERGEADAPVPDHGDDRLLGPRLLEGGPNCFDAAGVGVDVGAPRARALGLHSLLGERVGHPLGQLLGLTPLASPGLDDHPVEQDVRQRRVVALVARSLLCLLEVGSRASEVVDVTEPLAQLEDDPLVRSSGGSLPFEGERPLGGLPVEAFAEEEIGPHPGAQGRSEEARLGIGEVVEQPHCRARSGGGLR